MGDATGSLAAALEDYRADPGRAAATCFRRTRTPLPAHVQVLHASEDPHRHTTAPTRYFKLVHALGHIDVPTLPEAHRLVDVHDDAWTDQIVRVIDDAYHHTMNVDADTVRGWRGNPTACPDLWLGLANTDGELVGCAISDLDPSVAEGSLEWVQVLPDAQGRGMGRALVLSTLQRMQGRADFAVVSGEVDNPTSPEALYRSCGFTGEDLWHVYTAPAET